MREPGRNHRRLGRRVSRVLVTLGAAGAVAVSLGVSSGQATSSVSPLPSDNAATSNSFTPFTLPVTTANLPANTTSPAVDPAAPYTPVVVSLIAQLEGGSTTAGSIPNSVSVADLANADALLHDGT